MATTIVRMSPLPASNKRKRGPSDQDSGRNSKMERMNGESEAGETSYTPVELMQTIMPGEDDSSRTAQAALATPVQPNAYPEPGSFDDMPGSGGSFEDGTPANQGQIFHTPGQSVGKPAVGTDEWHQQRKNNHKEVERRRREVINEGIENIAKLVPNCEKNKGAVLQRTCQYIIELQNNEQSQKNERATFEIALKELTNRAERFKQAAEGAWVESNKWQQRCRDAGLQFDDYDEGALPGIGEDGDAVDEAYGK